MQLPASIVQAPLNSPVGQRPSTPVDNRTARAPESNRSTITEAETAQTQRPQEREAQPPVQAPERVSAPNQAEVPSQDPALRESIPTQNDRNPGLSQYRQVAQQGVDNAQAQDPSLFRVDVYV